MFMHTYYRKVEEEVKRKDSVFLLLLSGYMFVHTSRLHKHIHVNVHSLKVNQRYTHPYKRVDAHKLSQVPFEFFLVRRSFCSSASRIFKETCASVHKIRLGNGRCWAGLREEPSSLFRFVISGNYRSEAEQFPQVTALTKTGRNVAPGRLARSTTAISQPTYTYTYEYLTNLSRRRPGSTGWRTMANECFYYFLRWKNNIISV